MSLGLLASAFGLIFVAELPDKTMIATIVMGSRGNPRAVWLGASAAFVAQMALACAAGQLLNLLPRTVIEVVVTILFLGGAAYLLLVSEEEEIEEGLEEAESERPSTSLRTARTAFVIIFIAEFGDLTQILAASLAARSNQPFTIFVASSLALVAIAALGSFGGSALLRVLPLARIRQLSGVLLLGIGIFTLVSIFTG